MDVGAELLSAIPHDPHAAFVLADYLEERGEAARGELLRLVYTLTRAIDVPGRPWLEERLRALLARGVRPVGPYEAVALAPGVELVLAWVPPGTFLMGSPPGETAPSAPGDQHVVTLTQGSWLGVYPVTQAQWGAIMGSNHSHFQGEDRPAERMSRADCERFCKEMSARDGERYGLPTEAQWEYACRAGTTTPFHFGHTISTDLANYDGNYVYGSGRKGVYRRQTTPVGSFVANAWGLYDMHGNVWEMCENGDRVALGPEWSIEEYLKRMIHAGAPLVRGGSWSRHPSHCRAGARHTFPDICTDRVGFRLCLRPD